MTVATLYILSNNAVTEPTMPSSAIVVFTGKSVEAMLAKGGSDAWVLDPSRARRCQYVVCTRNTHADFATPGPAEHGAAFLVGRVRDIIRVDDSAESHRYLIAFGEYAPVDVSNAWKGWRNPVRYSSLEDIGVDLAALEWHPMPEGSPRIDQVLESGSARKFDHPMTIAEAKRELAAAFGVGVDAVEITIRG